MTEEHFNNGKTLLDTRNRIRGLKILIQGDSNIAILDHLRVSDTNIYTQIRDFAIEKLKEEDDRLQAAFDGLKEPEVTNSKEKIEREKN